MVALPERRRTPLVDVGSQIRDMYTSHGFLAGFGAIDWQIDIAPKTFSEELLLR